MGLGQDIMMQFDGLHGSEGWHKPILTNSGKQLAQRDNDKAKTVQKRLDVYSAQTHPLVDYYSA